MFYSSVYHSPIGKLTLTSDGLSLIGLWIQGQKYFCAGIPEQMHADNSNSVLRVGVAWLDRYFGGEKPDLDELPLAPQGGEFRQAVWQILREIPYGEVTTYGAIAKQMALRLKKVKMSAQAVGGAVSHNPISIIVPCHRVVGTNGNLTGYAAGIKTKIRLLELEGVNMNSFFVPKKGSAL